MLRRVFVGSQVQVVGAVRASASGNSVHPITSTYTIDNEVVGSFTAAPGDAEQDGVAFFSSKNLELAFHVLVMNVTSASDDYPFILDYVMFVPAPTLSSTFSLSVAPSSSAPSSSDLTAGISFTAATTTTESVISSSEASGTAVPIVTAAGSSSSSHAGPIAGGVIGGIVLLLALGALFWWYRRRRGSAEGSEVAEKGTRQAFLCANIMLSKLADGASVRPLPPHSAIPGITPFLLPRDYSGPSANVVPPETAAPLAPRSVLGTPDTPLASGSSKAALIAALSDRNGSGSVLASGSGGRSTPSEVSSASGSRSTTQLLASSGPGEGDQSAESSVPPRRRRRDKNGGVHSPQSSGPPPPPGQQDDSLSQAPTEFPPAYTPS